MPKFLFIYRDPAEKTGPEPSPDEMQAHIQLWWDWLGKGQADGWVVAMGEALTPEVKIVKADQSVTDGPYPEAKEIVGGYSIVQADSFEAACAHASGCPIYPTGGCVEVRQIMDLPQPE